jgi:ATP synthase protein I
LKIFDFKKDRAWLEHLAVVSQVGLTMAGSVVFCFAIGYFLDKWLGIRGLFSIIFILLGIAGGGYTAFRQISQVVDLKGKPGSRKDKNNG